ncbi:MAG: hypothetical protein JO016_19960 [Actinobacteria bacterium]|nr:hypothetical protein [Actinomycetota bacterium]
MALDRPATPPDRPETPSTPDAPPDPRAVPDLTRAEAFASHRYWSEVSRFSALWAAHKERWAAEPKKRDQPGGAAPAEVADSIARVKAAETVISSDVEAVASDNSPRGWLEGFSFRLKGEGRLAEKVASARESSSPDATIGEIVQQIPDAIRYTFCFAASDYTSGYFEVTQRLEARGYRMYKCRNSWADSEYKGVNTRWVTSEGQRFEVQFHTPESFHAKHEVTHGAYERIRDSATTANERRDLSVFQQEVSSRVPVPARVSDIADHSERGY